MAARMRVTSGPTLSSSLNTGTTMESSTPSRTSVIGFTGSSMRFKGAVSGGLAGFLAYL